MRRIVAAHRSTESKPEAVRVAAFQALAEQHIHLAYKLANAVLADPPTAQDAVHDAFVKAWDRWPSLRDPATAGERFLIERDHKPLAVLVSVEDAERLEDDPERIREQRRAAWEALDDWRRRYRAMLPTDYEEIDVVEWLRADRESH